MKWKIVLLRIAEGPSFEDTFQKLKEIKYRCKDHFSIVTPSVKLRFVAGDYSTAAMFVPEDSYLFPSPNFDSALQPQHLEGVLDAEVLDVDLVSQYVLAKTSRQPEFTYLKCCAVVADVY